MKIIILFLTLLGLFQKSSSVTAQEYSPPNPISCETRMFLGDSSIRLPYQYNHIEIKDSSTVRPGDYLIYTVRVKNKSNQERQIIKKIYIQHLRGKNEPITILDTYAINGSCSLNNQDNSLLCLTEYSFVDEATDPVYVLLKINDSVPNEIVNTSSLFNIQTNLGKTECANQLYLKKEKKENPINWSTPYAKLNSKNFFIRIGDKKFYGKEPIKLDSDPGVEKTTLEAIWQENDVEMRMFMYFKIKEKNMWELYDLRTYNGKAPGDWIYYKESLGNPVESLVGYPNYSNERRFIPTGGEDAEIYCKECSISAFLKINIPVSDYGYFLEPLIGLPRGKIITITNNPLTEYGVNVLLKNQAGEIVKNQRGITYHWEVSNPNIAQIQPSTLKTETGCLYEIQPPCPLNHIDITGINPGKTEIKVKAIKETEKIILASISFPIMVVAENSLPDPKLCALKGEVIKKDYPLKCCNDLVLVPPIDDRIDIFGTCLKPCYQNEDCSEQEICNLTPNNQLVCIPGTKNNQQEEIKMVKEELKKISEEQNKINILIDKIIAFIKKFFGFKI